MQLIKDQQFGGERPLFASHDLHLDNVTILAGESAIKECSNIVATNCRFEGNYPFWHVHGFTIDHCHFAVGGRSALWYSDHLVMRDTVVDAPKMFREMDGIDIENVCMNDADETFWRCSRIRAKNLTLHGGTYPFMFSSHIYVDGLESDSKYVFLYVKDVEIHHARITTKDSFWEAEDVTIYDSVLDGEYLGWHSKNLRLVNCHISGEQPLCYAHGLVLENCTFDPRATAPSNTPPSRPTSVAPSPTSRTPRPGTSWPTASAPSPSTPTSTPPPTASSRRASRDPAMKHTDNLSPVKPSERYIILGALRGFALLGICMANFPEFSLYTFSSIPRPNA